jgi:hypothetical protein
MLTQDLDSRRIDGSIDYVKRKELSALGDNYFC